MFTIVALVLLSVPSLAVNLFVSSYAGNVTSLSLTEQNASYSLEKTFSSPACGPNPSWLTNDANRGLLFCLNEGLDTINGSLSSFTINLDGSLNHVKNASTISGPVSGIIYGSPAGRRAIALAHYTGSALSTWYLDGGGHFHPSQVFTFDLSKPGAVPDRQEAPHEHEVITDPTGQYVIVPDLGADLVRVFAIDPDTLKLTAKAPLSTPSGTGPRHAVFYNPYTVACEGCTTYFYVLGELASDVTGYSIKYIPNRGGLQFTRVFQSSTLGLLNHGRINAPAEVQISPDNRFLLISNRNSTLFSLPNPNPSNNTAIPSDALTTFSLHHDGSLKFVQIWPSGGLYPRQFTLNAAGNLLAVGNQLSANVAILSRDVATGLIGEPIARVPIDGNITCVVFDE